MIGQAQYLEDPDWQEDSSHNLDWSIINLRRNTTSVDGALAHQDATFQILQYHDSPYYALRSMPRYCVIVDGVQIGWNSHTTPIFIGMNLRNFPKGACIEIITERSRMSMFECHTILAKRSILCMLTSLEFQHTGIPPVPVLSAKIMRM
jgi:hypothetical protein